jgi:Ca2+-binding RTX toxin-like protein
VFSVSPTIRCWNEQATSHQIRVAVADGTSFYEETFTIKVKDVEHEKTVGRSIADRLVGGAEADTLDGGSKGYGDTLKGGGGRDLLVAPDKGFAIMRGGSGRDTLDGSQDEGDTADYSDKSKGIHLTLGNGSAYSDVKVGGRSEDSIRRFEHVNGGDGDDWIAGNDKTNSLVGGAGRDTLSGGGDQDLLEGGNGRDSLSGGGGRDYINGGGGRDVLRGGGSDDTFMFQKIETGTADTIKDFVHNVDRLQFTYDFFVLVKGNVNKSEFELGTAADDPNDYIIYDRATGRLYVDRDGNGAEEQVHFATLSNKPLLDAEDFW